MSNGAFSFQTLTPELILDSLASIGIYVDSGLTALNSYENRVYQFSDENRTRYVVKYYRPQRWNKSQIVEEHQLTQQLSLSDIPVIAPLAINNNTVHEYQGYFFALFPSVGARQYETDNLQQFDSVATMLGRIHQIGAKQLFEHRPTISLEEYLYQPKEILLFNSIIPSKIQSDLKIILTKLIQAVEQHWHNDWQAIRLHADCHPGNILWHDQAIMVDFDDARNGPTIQDVWMLLNGDRQQQQFQLASFVELYEEFYPFDISQLTLIEPLRAMRIVHHLAWIIERWQDPAFPRAFPWLSDIDFWQQQLKQFNQQIEAIKAPSLQLPTII
jgi:Ser/Thr protein kinase RdoA (MazF antagonist)